MSHVTFVSFNSTQFLQSGNVTTLRRLFAFYLRSRSGTWAFRPIPRPQSSPSPKEGGVAIFPAQTLSPPNGKRDSVSHREKSAHPP